jgi:arylsulfatase I/J
MSLLAFCVLASSVACASSAAPNIFLVVVDDFGWHYGTHTSGNASISSSDSIHPHMDQLVKEGVELNRHYVHPTCTPSRASIQTGRLPVHILTKLVGPCDTNGAIPYNMTGIAR